MKLRKKIKIVIFLLFCFFLFKKTSLAAGNSFVNIVNPVRGDEFFEIKPVDILGGVRIQKSLTDEYKLNGTWLLRYDALNSLEFTSFFQNGFDGDEIGIFMEVTPKMALASNVSFPKRGIFWHDANRIFLSGYTPEQRIKLIDSIFLKFKDVFGYYPKSVGAWHIDAYSALYMYEKYNVTSVLVCADQFGTDSYQIWGGWWGVPYYPSKYNILSPAQTVKNKINLVVSWWAARDPQLGYGGSAVESVYSVQANDYIFGHKLGIDYFRKLLDFYLKAEGNKYSQITVGLENDMDFKLLEKGFSEQLQEIAKRKNNGEISVVTMSEFSDWYRNIFKELSPPHYLENWMMSKDFRLGYFEKDGKKYIRDLRIYNEIWPEANLLTANPWPSLSLNNPYKIDTVRFSGKYILLPENTDIKNLIALFGEQNIPFKIDKIFLSVFFLTIFFLTAFFLRKKLILFLIVIIGSLSLSLVMIKSGLVCDYGMGFWGPNGHDGIWHLALIESLNSFSLVNPVFGGAMLTNYHIGFDLLAAILHKITQIPTVNLYFQVFPPILAILIGIFTFSFVLRWTNSTKGALWATFFVYFGGSWGWLVNLIRNGSIGGESMFWANQSVSTLINPPYALSLIVLLFGLILFLKYSKNPSLKNLLFCSLILGLLIQIKVYAGVITIFSLFILAASRSLHREEGTVASDFWKLFFLTLVFSMIIFLPFNFSSGSLLVFSLFWFPHTMISYSDRLGWFKLENARLAYFQSGKWLKWFIAEGAALLIFVFGNLGTRVAGFFAVKFLIKTKGKISSIEIIILSMLLSSLTIPLVFIQKGNSWNTIQFYYYFQFFMSILSGVVIGKWLNSEAKSLKLIITKFTSMTLLVLLTAITTFSTLKNDYLPSRPPSRISIEELEALNFLKSQKDGVVLTYPYNTEWKNIFSEPRSLYAYEATAYVSALASKTVFLEDEMNLEITGFDWKSRNTEISRFFLTADQKWGRKFLIRNNIKYIYLVKGQNMNLGLGDIIGEKIFENGEVMIYLIH